MTGGTGSQRRAPTAKGGADDPNPFVAAVHAIRAESGGMLDLIAVRPIDLAFVVAGAAAGDTDALRVLTVLDNAVRRISAAPRRSPARCASCARPLLSTTAYNLCVVEPSRKNPTSSLAVAVCPRCATTPQEITAKAAAALRAVWPDLSSRPIAVTHPTGGQA